MHGQLLKAAPLAAMAAQAQPQQLVVQALNDVQLVCLLAAQRPEWPAQRAVDWAVDLVAEAKARCQGDWLGDAIKAKQRLREPA